MTELDEININLEIINGYQYIFTLVLEKNLRKDKYTLLVIQNNQSNESKIMEIGYLKDLIIFTKGMVKACSLLR